MADLHGDAAEQDMLMARRPPHVKPPAYLTKSVPVPAPRDPAPARDPLGQDPTRYGDWTLKGIAVDF